MLDVVRNAHSKFSNPQVLLASVPNVVLSIHIINNDREGGGAQIPHRSYLNNAQILLYKGFGHFVLIILTK